MTVSKTASGIDPLKVGRIKEDKELDKFAEERFLKLEPIKIGLHGMEWRYFEREVRLAFDQAIEKGIIDRRYEIVIEENAGLPQDTAQGGIDSYHRLCDAGCLVVLGANYTDSAIPLVEHTYKRKVPIISMCGTDQFHGDFCFRLGNGDVGDEPALIASWLHNQGHKSISVVTPASPIGEEYFFYLKQECRRYGIAIRAVESIIYNVKDLTGVFNRLKSANADALVWCGYGGLFVADRVRPALKEADWDPPRIVTTAFMQYIWGKEFLDGWVGIDQWCPDNPRVEEFHRRFRASFDDDPWMWPNAIPGLAYDMAQVAVEAIHRAPILTGTGIKKGIERIKYLPAVTGGPSTHISGGPYDHQLFKGDWLVFGRMEEGGNLAFEGLWESSSEIY